MQTIFIEGSKFVDARGQEVTPNVGDMLDGYGLITNRTTQEGGVISYEIKELKAARRKPWHVVAAFIVFTVLSGLGYLGYLVVTFTNLLGSVYLGLLATSIYLGF